MKEMITISQHLLDLLLDVVREANEFSATGDMDRQFQKVLTKANDRLAEELHFGS